MSLTHGSRVRSGPVPRRDGDRRGRPAAGARPGRVAAAPVVETWSNPRYGPYLDCPTFAVYGDWTVSHRLTTFFTADGPTRDIELVSSAAGS